MLDMLSDFSLRTPKNQSHGRCCVSAQLESALDGILPRVSQPKEDAKQR